MCLLKTLSRNYRHRCHRGRVLEVDHPEEGLCDLGLLQKGLKAKDVGTSWVNTGIWTHHAKGGLVPGAQAQVLPLPLLKTET